MKETELQRAILDYLKIRGHLVKRNQSGMIKKDSHFIHMGEKGWPDIIGIAGSRNAELYGKFIGIEVKLPKGKTTPAQEEILGEIRSRNGIAFVAHSLDEVIAAGL